MTSLPQYSELPPRAAKVLENFNPPHDLVEQRLLHFASVEPRARDRDGDTEVLDGVKFTHRFVSAPGDGESIEWHYVECGQGEPIVFLHGIPDS